MSGATRQALRPGEHPRDERGLIWSLLHRGPVSALELSALALLGAAVFVATVWVLRIPFLLGHDESVYAVMARDWSSGWPGSVVADHRAPLLPVLGAPLLAAGGDDLALRAIGVLAAVGGVCAVWWLGRMIGGPVAGLTAAAVYAFAPPVFDAGARYLTDMPSAVVLVALTGLLWSQFVVRPAPDRRLLLAAPLACAAYELRFGSALPVILLFGMAGAVFWPKIRRYGRLVGATIGVLLLLLTPHLLNATMDLGAPWQRLLYTSSVAGRDRLGQGLAEYVRWFPSELAGPIAAVLMAIGLVGTVIVWINAAGRGHDRTGPSSRQLAQGLTFLVVPALMHVVSIGIASHGEPRFVFFPVALLCIAGAVILTAVLRGLERRSVLAVWVVLGVLAFGMMFEVARLAPTLAGDRADVRERDLILLDAAQELNALSTQDCSVLTTYGPQISWYADCASLDFDEPPAIGPEAGLTDDAWMLLFEQGKRQPEGDALQFYLRRSELVAEWDPPREGLFGSASLYRLGESQSARSPTQPSAAMQ